MSRICFPIRYSLCAFAHAVVCLLTSCGINVGDTDNSVEVSSNPGPSVTGNQFLISPTLLYQQQINEPVPESVVVLLTLMHSRPVLGDTGSAVEIQYIVNGLSSSVSSFQIEYADSGLPIEAAGCQVLTLQSLLDYGFVCQGDILVDKSNTAIRIKLRLQNGRDAYSNNVTLPSA